MKIVTLIIWLFCYNLFAIDDYYPIKVLDTGKTTSLKNIIYQYDEIEELVKEVNDLAYDRYKEVVYSKLAKEDRYAKNDEINDSVLETLAEKYTEE